VILIKAMEQEESQYTDINCNFSNKNSNDENFSIKHFKGCLSMANVKKKNLKIRLVSNKIETIGPNTNGKIE
jgi:hypothetical protein